MSQFYSGALRQSGGSIGGFFGPLARTMIPILKNVAMSQAKELGPSVVKQGVGLMADVAMRRNLKTSVKRRGKRLLATALRNNANRIQGGLKRRGGKKKKKAPAKTPRRLSAARRGAKTRRRADVFDR